MATYRRAPIKKRNPVQQVVDDVVHGGQELIQQGKVAVERVRAGAKKTLQFLRGKR